MTGETAGRGGESRRAGRCAVSLGALASFGRMPGGNHVWGWEIHWLPKGYGPTLEDKPICCFAHPADGSWDKYGLDVGKRPPIVEAVCAAIERFMSDE